MCGVPCVSNPLARCRPTLLKIEVENVLATDLNQAESLIEASNIKNASLQNELQRQIKLAGDLNLKVAETSNKEAQWAQIVNDLEKEINDLKLKEAVRLSLEAETAPKKVSFDPSNVVASTPIPSSRISNYHPTSRGVNLFDKLVSP